METLLQKFESISKTSKIGVSSSKSTIVSSRTYFCYILFHIIQIFDFIQVKTNLGVDLVKVFDSNSKSEVAAKINASIGCVSLKKSNAKISETNSKEIMKMTSENNSTTAKNLHESDMVSKLLHL